MGSEEQTRQPIRPESMRVTFTRYSVVNVPRSRPVILGHVCVRLGAGWAAAAVGAA